MDNRIQREIRQVQADKTANVSIDMVADNVRHLKGTITGPADTPYAGGQFILDIVIPDEYPFKPPKMKFDTVSSERYSPYSLDPRPFCLFAAAGLPPKYQLADWCHLPR